MPHKASVLLQSTNAVTGDPAYLSERNGAIAGVDSIAGLVDALSLGADENLVRTAHDIDGFLPPAIVQAILAGYKGAAAAGTDGVFATWTRGAGFNVNVSQDQGTDAVDDQGVVSIAIGSPKFTGPA